MAVAVVKDDAVVEVKGDGGRAIGGTAAVDQRTSFGIGSNAAALRDCRAGGWWIGTTNEAGFHAVTRP
jgi:hypothetical protein